MPALFLFIKVSQASPPSLFCLSAPACEPLLQYTRGLRDGLLFSCTPTFEVSHHSTTSSSEPTFLPLPAHLLQPLRSHHHLLSTVIFQDLIHLSIMWFRGTHPISYKCLPSVGTLHPRLTILSQQAFSLHLVFSTNHIFPSQIQSQCPFSSTALRLLASALRGTRHTHLPIPVPPSLSDFVQLCLALLSSTTLCPRNIAKFS